MASRRAPRFQESGMRLLVDDDRIALCGGLADIRTHAHATAAVVIGVDRPLGFVARERRVEARAALLAPGFAHAVDVAGGRIAVFFLPARSVSAEAAAPARALAPGPWIELAAALAEGELYDFREVDRALARGDAAPRPIDDRLADALALVADTLDRNVPLDELAAEVRLSGSRLRALARDQLGTTLRAYRRWLRMFRVARGYAAGASLTEAAVAAGFASSAHLAMAARSQFGVPPTSVLRGARLRLV
jgi:AraC-like DNA-binding protein